ncbi:MAG: Xaa-Pro peptidase family protein, partial [Chloroflexota bacterium]|nr:Xaa-Pro peptidase family protein [Chloroflexota bacterium]
MARREPGGLAGRIMTGVAGRPTIPAARFADRIARAAQATSDRGFDALLVGVGPDLRYLTGYEALPLERLTMLVLSAATGGPRLVAPRLELAAARAGVRPDVPIVTWEETEDPYVVVARLVSDAGRSASRVGVSDRLWASHLLRLEAVLPGARFESATAVMRDLRMVKDSDEIELLRLAAHAADRVIAQIAAGRLVGRTEADVAREVRERLLAEGHELAEFSIVASGPNSASPHHEASERVIRAGEPIVLDIGGTLGGYGSDITRMVWVTGGDPAKGPDPEYLRLYGILQDSQDEATGAVRPGVPCEQIDAVARGIIETGGYGPQFIHRTGHGIGLEGHEEPYLVAGNSEPLREGTAFSVEPGIYLEGRYGARIEDIVVCGPSGPIVLN